MIQDIFIGNAPNDKTGTPARQAGQMINANFAYLNGKIDRKDGIVASTGLTVVGQDATMNAFWEWIIDTVEYTNPYAVVLNFPLATAGNSRLDLIALTTSNTAIRIPGTESTSNPISPVLPENMLQASMVLVTDSFVDDPSSPVLGTDYVKKAESQDFIANYGATTVIDQINLIDDRSSISLIGSATDVKSVQVSGEFIRPGKPHFFKNRTGHDVKLWHLSGTGNIKYFFPNASDLIVKPNEVIQFNTNANDSAYVRFEYVGVISEAGGVISNSDVFSKEKLTIVDVGTNSGFVNVENGISGGSVGTENFTVSFPAIDYTKKFRIDVVVKIKDSATANARIEIKKNGNSWQGLSYLDIGGSSLAMNKSHLNTQGIGSVPSNSTFQYSIIGNGKRVIRNVIPISTSWDGSYSTTFLPSFTGQIISQSEVYNYDPSGTVEMFKDIDIISVTGTDTDQIVVESINVQYFDNPEIYDHKKNLATLMDISVLNDAIDNVYPAYLYCPPNPKALIQWHHPNGYNGTIENSSYGTFFPNLYNDGYAICYGTFNSFNNPSGTALWGAGVTSSNWGAPTGLVYRKALNDYVDSLINAEYYIQIGASMGAFNALSYTANYPDKIKKVIGISSALDLTANYTTGFTSQINKAYGAAYRCIQASTGNATSNSSYWVKISNEKNAPSLDEYVHPFYDTYSPGKDYIVGEVVFENYTGVVGGLSGFDLILNPRNLTNIPILLIHGDSDSTISSNQSVNFKNAINAVGGDVTLYIKAGYNHLDIPLFDYGLSEAFLNDTSEKQDVLTEANFGAFENSLTAKATPLDADLISIIDSADSNKAKKTTFVQIKAFLKTYFDSIYGIIFGIVNVAGTTYQFLLTDNGKKIVTSSATAVTVTIPTNATVGFPIGARIKLTQQGNGVVTLVVTGLTIVSSSPLYTVKGQTITLEKTAINTWTIEGNNLNGEIMLPAFPNTRNDGQIPTNRILSTDASGNLKMYTIATAPAPYLYDLIPDSYLPSNTGNFVIKGAFFTPTMTVAIQGQTVNNFTFINDNEVRVNVTTGAAEGLFDVTLNNGLQTVISKRFLVVLGTVFNPVPADWINISGNIDVSEGINLKSTVANTSGYAEYNRLANYSKNYRVYFDFTQSPLTTNVNARQSFVRLQDNVTGTFLAVHNWGLNTVSTYQNSTLYGNSSCNWTGMYLEKIGSTVYLKSNGSLVFTFSNVLANDMRIMVGVNSNDIYKIKYVELA